MATHVLVQEVEKACAPYLLIIFTIHVLLSAQHSTIATTTLSYPTEQDEHGQFRHGHDSF
jgi:hypothetical protein